MNAFGAFHTDVGAVPDVDAVTGSVVVGSADDAEGCVAGLLDHYAFDRCSGVRFHDEPPM